jgi:hypothetical protein
MDLFFAYSTFLLSCLEVESGLGREENSYLLLESEIALWEKGVNQQRNHVMPGVTQLSASACTYLLTPRDIGLHSPHNIKSFSANKKNRGFSRTSEVTYKKQTRINPGFGGVHKRFSEIRAANQFSSGTFACVEKTLSAVHNALIRKRRTPRGSSSIWVLATHVL